MSLFQKNTQNLSPRQQLQNKYGVCRVNLMVVVLLTLINVVFLLLGSDTYWLFSALVPYLLVFYGMFFCGKLPVEYYEGDISDYVFLDESVLVVLAIFAFAIVGLYLLFWWLSREHRSGWLVASLVLFIIDTLVMLWFYGLAFDMIIDLLFHIWVLYYLIAGISAAKRFKELPPEEPDKNEEVEGQDFYPEMVSIGSGKQVDRIAANYYRGKEAVGGWIYFYNDRVIFKSHTLNIQTGNTTILYSDMVSTGKYSNLGFIHNGLTITTQDGTVHKFVVNRRDSVIAHLDRQILRNNA